MGLDQYLFKRRKGSSGDDEELMYWRKANQIREWFVTNTDYPSSANCEEHVVTKEQLQKLVDDCKAALDTPNTADDVMPRSDGFFFGSQEYDELYFRDLKNTIDAVQHAIDDTDFDTEEVFYYEWW